MRMERALLSIEERGQHEKFTDPAPLEGSCNIGVQCVMYTNLSLFLTDELSSLTAVTSWSMIGTGLL